jgi:hypothetical protein
MRRIVTLVVIGVAAVLIVAAAVLIIRGRTGGADVYHVSVGAPVPGNPGAPQQDGSVKITIADRTVTSGPDGAQRVDFPYGRKVTVRPGERIAISAASRNRAITCTIVHDPGPGADTVAYSEPSKRDPSTGEWRGGCSWSRPS